ncbi:putative trans-acylase protein [Neisseria gonorrhoeae]|uniref:Putative trans-acylase protein n=1 Tax=Neisseria gonorrhoeae TaxID=485 RepID=A0A379B246_NEIGO|nr:putative trans-acylase protein [Neisseria gonorrhoeae]
MLSLLCFGALLVCLFVIDKHDPFIPGITLLLPCLLTALLIRSMQYGTLPTRILSASPIVFVGKISYSLYLYHWILLPSPITLQATNSSDCLPYRRLPR